MQQLINLVAQKAGLDQNQARTAVETVVGFLKDRVPGPLARQLDNAIDGGEGQQTQGKGEGLRGKIPGL